MRRSLAWMLFAVCVLFSTSLLAQTTTVSGSVHNGKTNEAVPAASVMVKGSNAGTYTDDHGNFKLTVNRMAPFTLVISSIGFGNKEISVTGNNQSIDANLDVAYTLGTEIVVSASRLPERILESPVSIERISAAEIRNTPASSYYDMLTNLKGVDVVTASLTFRSIGTRGFNVNGNPRLNQLVDGMDNQAPGLNFSLGGVIGLTELDVESMELLPGASSALYGSGGMNGTVLINSKDPFKYQGLSFQIKQGMNHVDAYQRPVSPFYDWTVRYAQKISDHFAYKINAQMVQAQDWRGNDRRDYSRTTGTPNGQVISGDRVSDPNYDGVNVYGDETNTASAGFTFNQVAAQVGAGLIAAGAAPAAAVGAVLSSIPANQNVSRTGYNEQDVINPTTVNVKLNGALFYKINDNLTASFTANYGTGSSVYTGTDRYSLQGLKMGQYKLELKSKDWFLRAYTTQEDAGESFDATVSTRLFNEAVKPSSTWFAQYAQAYLIARLGGAADIAAHTTARAAADAGRPTGFIGNNTIFQQITGTPISKGGGLFLDKTNLYVYEGQLNLTDILKLAKYKTELIVGGATRQYVLNSQGTLFADTSGKIYINEAGLYAQASHTLFNDVLKLTASGRYDKNSNFDGHFTPRFSAVVKLAEDHHIRLSYQTAYRFPTTQNQWINLLVGGGTRLMGGLPQLRDHYNFAGNTAYTLASFQQYAGTGNAGLLQEQKFGAFKPESSKSFEAGYKGLFGKRVLVDIYAYWAQYQDFLGNVTAVQSNDGTIAGLAANHTIYSISVNSPTVVNTSGWGASVQYMLGGNFTAGANIYNDNIGDLPAGFVSYFNTPKYRANLSFGNTGFIFKHRLGFSAVYRYQDGFFYEGTFGAGQLTSFATIDGMISYKFPEIRSMLKLGATNLFNKYYTNGFGNAQVGGLYYISFGYNVF